MRRSRGPCDITGRRHGNGAAPVIMVDSSQFIQLSAELVVVPLIVGGSATVIPGTTVYIHCPVANTHCTYDRPVYNSTPCPIKRTIPCIIYHNYFCQTLTAFQNSFIERLGRKFATNVLKFPPHLKGVPTLLIF